VCKEVVTADGNDQSIYDIVNPPGTFQHGQRLKEYTSKELPIFSARLFAEFDKRRNIKDMFKRQSSTVTPQETQETNSSTQDISQESIEPPIQNPMDKNTQHTQRTVTPTPPSPLKTAFNAKRKSQKSPATGTNKRSKASSSATMASAKPNGQQSLKGFFLPKQPQSQMKPHSFLTSSSTTTKASSPPSDTNPDVEGGEQDVSALENKSSELAPSPPNQRPLVPSTIPTLISADDRPDPFPGEDSEDVFDPIVSKESWSKLFKKREPPRCEDHNEPCISFETKKKGFNCGRSFWVCPR
jgi:AP endonuclease-2